MLNCLAGTKKFNVPTPGIKKLMNLSPTIAPSGGWGVGVDIDRWGPSIVENTTRILSLCGWELLSSGTPTESTGSLLLRYCLTEYSPIAFMFLTVPFTWFLHRFGLRISGVGGAWMMVVGCGIRVFVPFLPSATHWIWVMHLGHILIGVVGIPFMVMPSKVSSVWFPVSQRSFATAIAANAQGFGAGVGFLLIAFLTEQYGIRTMLYVQAELALFVAILATIYYPNAPPTPPSPSANEERSNFLQSLKMLLMNRNFVLLALSGGAITGAVL